MMNYHNNNTKLRYSTCYLIKHNRTIYFKPKINSFSILHFITATNYAKELGYKEITIDFSNVLKVFPNGILPIICTVENLRVAGLIIKVKLPRKDDIRKLFRSVNWAYFLSPTEFEKSDSTYDRHLVTRRFENAEEQKKAVDDFMDVILRNLTLPKDLISGIEWSINEITDNVLNHSNSKSGGLIQATTYVKEQKIGFVVADTGRGILASMREGFPDLRTELDAIGEAIKSGVTRNPKFGQGNGLAGSLRVTTFSGGSLEILSGNGRLKVTELETTRKGLNKVKYKGTLVCGEINLVENFSISKALDFNNLGEEYVALNIIDTKYEMEDEDCLLLVMKEETTGFGSRKSGSQIRTKVNNLMNAKPAFPIVIDWTGIPVISSSFADEFMGKLFLNLGAITFTSFVRNKSMEPLIVGLLDKAIAQRLSQAVDEEF